MKTNKYLHLLLATVVAVGFMSCGKVQPKRPPIDLDKARTNSNAICVPFTERDNAIIIPVKLNDVSMDMIFDTGNTGNVLISLLELQMLYKNGKFDERDIIGTTYANIADGSVVEEAVIRLHSIKITDELELTDIEAHVAPNQAAPLLLGRGVMDKIASKIEVDNINKTINFTPW